MKPHDLAEKSGSAQPKHADVSLQVSIDGGGVFLMPPELVAKSKPTFELRLADVVQNQDVATYHPDNGR